MHTRRETWLAWLTLAPPLSLLLLAFIWPVAQFLALAFESEAGPFAPFSQLLAVGVYRRIFGNTMAMAAVVTLACVLIAYPVAFVLNQARGIWFRVVLYCVLFPLWVSVLVRTFSWILILERNGPLNRNLIDAGLIDEPLKLLFSNTGVFLGMVHVLVPYAVLPIYTSISRIDPHLLLASDGLGATPLQSFRRVWLPLSLPGVAGGAGFVFLLSLGFFVTPALLGGVNAISLSMLIQQFVTEQLDWPRAAAASIILFAAVLLVLAVSARFLRLGQSGAR